MRSASLYAFSLQTADVEAQLVFRSGPIGCAPFTFQLEKEHTMLTKTIAVTALLAALAVPALASDDGHRGERERFEHSDRGRCLARPAAERLSVDQVAQKLKEQGYTVRKIKASHGCYEVRGTDAKGVRVEMYVNPATAEIIGRGDRS
jgi:hypothetical protein